MPQLLLANAITYCRAEIDDAIDGKVIFNYSPLLGVQDGVNKIFQIPAQRVVIGTNFIVYKNGNPLAVNTDYTVLNAKTGQIQFTVAPAITDSMTTTFPYTWADDTEVDHYLNRAANELGLVTYHTDPSVAPFELQLDSSSKPIVITDFASGLQPALIYLGAAHLASALSSRFSQRYDISAGDKSYSASQMATAYEKLSTRLMKQGLTARDDFYKGQGTQYRPAMASQGYVLPNWTPRG